MKINFPGIVVTNGEPSPQFMDELNRATQDWTMRAARGECGWICADCCASFSEGMPDACEHGHDSCTSIIQRDKQRAVSGHEWCRTPSTKEQND